MRKKKQWSKKIVLYYINETKTFIFSCEGKKGRRESAGEKGVVSKIAAVTVLIFAYWHYTKEWLKWQLPKQKDVFKGNAG